MPRQARLDAPGFAERVGELLAAYPPQHVAAQLNLLGSHDTPRALALCGEDEASIRIATLLQMAMPGAPCIYYGDEIGMTGRADPDCRRTFPVSEAAWNLGLLRFMQGAVAARAADPALRGDGFRKLATTGTAVAFERSDGRQRSVVVVNAGEEPVALSLPGPLRVEGLTESLTSDGRSAEPRPAAQGGVTVAVPARWGGIWQVDRIR